MKFRIGIIYLLLFVLSAPVLAQVKVQSRPEVAGRKAYIQGIEAFSFKEYDRAKELLTNAYELLGPEPGISFALADTYFALNDLALAAFYGKEASSADPENKYYRLKLAEIYKQAGQNQDTIDELTKL